MSQLITKIEEILPKEKDEYEARKKNNWDLAIGYNECLSDIKQTLPQILDLVREEVKQIDLHTFSDCHNFGAEEMRRRLLDLLED